MAANDVQIRIRAEDFASSVLNNVASSASKTTSSLDSLGRTARGFVFNAAGVAAGIAGFQGLSAAITGTANSVFNFTRAMETNEIGIAGILSSMTQINGKNLEWNQAMGISKRIMQQLSDEALRTNATTEELVTTFRALLGPGLGANMKTDEIIKLSSVGATAVKALGLNGTQLVQELRDLVQGGIQPASSTLATALGLKDKDIKAAKESSEGLFKFLMERLAGFSAAGDASKKTLDGIIDQIKEGTQRIGAQGTAPIFGAVKMELSTLANGLIYINEETKKVELNPNLINDLTYASNKAVEIGGNFADMVKPLGAIAIPAVKSFGEAIVFIGENMKVIGTGVAAWLAVGKVSAMYMDLTAAATGATTANSLLGRAVVAVRADYMTQALAARETAQQEMQAAMQSGATMRREYALIQVQRKEMQMITRAALVAEQAGWEALSVQIVNLRTEYMRLGASAEQAGIMQLQAAKVAQTGNMILTQQIISSQKAHLEAAAAAKTSELAAVSGAGKAMSAVKTFGTAIWALAGGWLGVAAATGYALYKLYEYTKNKNTIEEKDYNRAKVRWNMEKQYWEVERAPDANHMFDWWENATAAEAEFINISAIRRKEQEREMEKSVYNGSEMNVGDLQTKFAPNVDDSVAKKATVQAEKESKEYEKQAKEAREEATALRNALMDNTGQFLGRDYGGSSINDWDKVCTTFVQSVWNAAGVANAEGLTAWAPDWKENLGGAYHAADGGYQPLPGDAVLVDYDGDGKADHVVMVDENQTGYYAASKPGVKSHHGSDLYGAFGNNIMGYGSATEYAGIAPGAKAYDKERAAAFKEAYQLAKEMQSGINEESGTEYSKGMYLADQDIFSKQHKIGRLKEQGVDTTELTKQLETYTEAVKEKVTDKWKQSWQTLKDDTKMTQAEIVGDATVFADAEYRATVSKLDEERKVREKAVMQDKNDAVAKAAVDEWYTEQIALGKQKRDAKYREDKLKQYEIDIEHNNMLVDLENKTQAEIDILNQKELQSKLIYLDQELQKAELSKEKRIAIEKEKVNAISALNNINSYDVYGAVGVATQDIKNQQYDFAELYKSTWADIDQSTNEHLKSILHGNERLSDGIRGILLDISKSVTDMFMDILVQSYILEPMKNMFTSFLGSTLGGGSSGRSGMKKYAAGGRYPGGPALVGEDGPELIDFATPGRVYTAKDTKNLFSGSNNKKQPIVMNMYISTPDTGGFKRSQGQIMAGLGRAIQAGQKNQ